MSIERAKLLRANPTVAEKRLWRLLYPLRTGGFHFRKQVAIGPYYGDFVCHHARLVIEVDGDQHGQLAGLAHDLKRDRYLMDRGFVVLRFGNSDVMNNPEGVFESIVRALSVPDADACSASTPSPALPARGRVQDGARASVLPIDRSCP